MPMAPKASSWHREPTDADIERWRPFLEKVKAAQDALKEADVILGQTLTALDDTDDRSIGVYEVYNRQLEGARMSVGSIIHPVEECWAGPGASRDSRHWRFPIVPPRAPGQAKALVIDKLLAGPPDPPVDVGTLVTEPGPNAAALVDQLTQSPSASDALETP